MENLDILHLTKEQLEAVYAARRCLEKSAQARALVQADTERLADPKQEACITAAPQELDTLYEGRRNMHAVMVLLSRLGWLRAEYARCGVPEAVLADSLKDVGLWMDVCREVTGEYGLLEYGWLAHTFRMQLVRVGRLQFMIGKGELPAHVFESETGEIRALAPEGMRYTPQGRADGANGILDANAWSAHFEQTERLARGHEIGPDGCARREQTELPMPAWRQIYSPGDKVLEIHIPAGEPLTRESALDAIKKAPALLQHWFGWQGARLFTCESWLLDDALQEMTPGGNICAFQELFARVLFAGSDAQAIERVFGFGVTQVPVLSQGSRLQRGMVEFYKRGGRCCDAYGYRRI